MKNNKGFSLIEILIAIGLLGALSAWMMNIFTQQTKNEKATATNMDIDSMGQEMRNIMADGRSCEKTFAGMPAIKLNVVSELQKVLSDGTAQKRFFVNEKKIGNSGVVITGFDLKADETYLIPAGQKVGETILIINYDRGKMVQGAKLKSFKIPLSVTVNEMGLIVNCHALASTTNLASICSSLGRSVNTAMNKCDPPSIYLKGDTPIQSKQYERCEGGSGSGEHTLAKWTAEGTGSIRVSWSGLANDTEVTWRIYKNNDILSSGNGTGISSEAKTSDLEVKKGDIIKHTVILAGGIDGDCISSGFFSVSLDLLNML